MFESGNIQARPIPLLYQKGELAVRTWNESAGLNAGIVGADYALVVVESSYAGDADVASLSSGLVQADYVSTIVEGGEFLDEAILDAGLGAADYVQVVLESAATTEAEEDISLECAGIVEADYALVIFEGAATETEQTTLNPSLIEASYELA